MSFVFSSNLCDNVNVNYLNKNYSAKVDPTDGNGDEEEENEWKCDERRFDGKRRSSTVIRSAEEWNMDVSTNKLFTAFLSKLI